MKIEELTGYVEVKTKEQDRATLIKLKKSINDLVDSLLTEEKETRRPCIRYYRRPKLPPTTRSRSRSRDKRPRSKSV